MAGDQNATNSSGDDGRSFTEPPNPPSAPPPSAPPSSAAPASGSDGSGRFGQFIDLAVPESTEPGKGRKWGLKRLALTAAGLFVAGAISTFLAFEFDLFTTEKKARTEDNVADKLDSEKSAFDWKMSPSIGADEPWESWEIDRRLTPAEQRELVALNGDDKGTVWEFVKRLGGRRVRGAAATYNLQLTSERQKPVLITRLTASATRCWPSTAKTAIAVPSGGTESWDDIHFNLDPSGTPVPAMTVKTTETAGARSPSEVRYNKAVSLGGTQSPGLLAVTPFLAEKRDCEWKINLTYNVNSGKVERKSITEDDSGNKLISHGLSGEGVDTWTWTGAAPNGSGWMR